MLVDGGATGVKDAAPAGRDDIPGVHGEVGAAPDRMDTAVREPEDNADAFVPGIMDSTQHLEPWPGSGVGDIGAPALISRDTDASGIDAPSPEPPGRVADAGGEVEPSRMDPGSAEGPDRDTGEHASPDSSPCAPANCGTHAWACWPMPNDPSSGLPNLARYKDMGDSTIRDEVTCLLWEQNPPSQGYSQESAMARCASDESLPGSGWRLPTRIELASIADYTKRTPPQLSEVFKNTQLNPPYWSASMVHSQPLAWTLRFYDGVFEAVDTSTWFESRCVKGGGEGSLPVEPPRDHYVLSSNSVRDSYTGLVWERGDSQGGLGPPIGWTGARAYCEALRLDGESWRLPSVKELATLMDDNAPLGTGAPVLDSSAFPSAKAAADWSRTSLASGDHWTFSFFDGVTVHTQSLAFVKCVH